MNRNEKWSPWSMLILNSSLIIDNLASERQKIKQVCLIINWYLIFSNIKLLDKWDV